MHIIICSAGILLSIACFANALLLRKLKNKIFDLESALLAKHWLDSGYFE